MPGQLNLLLRKAQALAKNKLENIHIFYVTMSNYSIVRNKHSATFIDIWKISIDSNCGDFGHKWGALLC